MICLAGEPVPEQAAVGGGLLFLQSSDRLSSSILLLHDGQPLGDLSKGGTLFWLEGQAVRQQALQANSNECRNKLLQKHLCQSC